MIKQFEVIFLKEAEEFIDTLDLGLRKKIFFAIRKTKARIIGNWFKKLKGTDEIFEFRIQDKEKKLRLFAFWDTRKKYDTYIVISHGILKKSNRIPKFAIRKVERNRKDYFADFVK